MTCQICDLPDLQNQLQQLLIEMPIKTKGTDYEVRFDNLSDVVYGIREVMHKNHFEQVYDVVAIHDEIDWYDIKYYQVEFGRSNLSLIVQFEFGFNRKVVRNISVVEKTSTSFNPCVC